MASTQGPAADQAPLRAPGVPPPRTYGAAGPPPAETYPRRAQDRADIESAGSGASNESSDEDPDDHKYQEIEETTHSGTMATVIKDLYMIYKTPPSKHVSDRVTRILFSLFISLLLVAIQLYVLFTVKTFVTSPAVRSIRQVYDEYQKTMYHGHVQDSGFGFALGIGGPKGKYFDPSQFDTLSGDMKGSVCLIPFSQPGYLTVILLVWMLSVIGELRTCVTLGQWLWDIRRVDGLEDMVESKDGEQVVTGLPVSMKTGITFIVLIPRSLTALLLAWLGCRWLAATLDFTEVLINCIALEFVIKLNNLIYTQLVSDRSKRDNRNLKMDMEHHTGSPPSALSFVGTAAWAFGAGVWIYLYINHLQLVLPGYQWDVRGPCTPWVAERFNFWRI